MRVAVSGSLRTDRELRDIQTAPVGPGLDTVGQVTGDPALERDLFDGIGRVEGDSLRGDVSVGTIRFPLLEGSFDTRLVEGLRIGGDPASRCGLGLGEEDTGGGDHGQGGIHGQHLVGDGAGVRDPGRNIRIAVQAERNTIEGIVGITRELFRIAGAEVTFDVEILEHAGILEFLHLSGHRAYG